MAARPRLNSGDHPPVRPSCSPTQHKLTRNSAASCSKGVPSHFACSVMRAALPFGRGAAAAAPTHAATSSTAAAAVQGRRAPMAALQLSFSNQAVAGVRR